MSRQPQANNPVRIAANTPRDEHTMHVEYVMPNGRRAVAHVPKHRWIEGGHTPVGPALAAMLAELDLQHERASSRLPE